MEEGNVQYVDSPVTVSLLFVCISAHSGAFKHLADS